MILSKLGLVKKKDLEVYIEELEQVKASIAKYNKAVQLHNELAFSDDGKLLEIELKEEAILNDIFQHIHNLNNGLKTTIDISKAKEKVHEMEQAKHADRRSTDIRTKALERKIKELEMRLNENMENKGTK